jgi:uncharacterized protein (DUF983 family)
MTADTLSRRSALGLVRAVLLQRCPACRRGRVFRRGLRMYDRCPACGHRFQEDEGFFLGAMYISYPLATLVLAACYFGLAAAFPGLTELPLFLLSVLGLLLFAVPVFRYSRIIWMHFISSTR